ncbi:unnamed protein product [Cylindrotheca closterium]|uniref:DUF6824 domain-containing protein n=1 Tax=Cylindrotheca closterium TaxID=2856 RepID=A0AAD2G4B4_9STRA|nr:unnamed protein product [Cylindrotheca closterium]
MNNNSWLQRLLGGTSATPISPLSADNNNNDLGATRQQLDSFLANSITQLDVRQRESILEDLHGIRNSENPENNPASVDLWLQLLDMHLQNIKRGTVYETAEAIDRVYVTSRKFRMMFLRANRYDSQAAAIQIIKFLELKRSLFGQEKLAKKITLADLDEDDKAKLQSGTLQISSKQDRAGRGVFLMFPSLRSNGTEYQLQTSLRARYYMVMNMLESEENQRNGIVMVYFGALSQPTQRESNSGLLWDLPFRLVGVHCCFNSLAAYLFISVAILRLPFAIRPRMRVHYGSCADCLYKLASFGIPKEAVLNESDEPNMIAHMQWYRRRQELELTYVSDSDTDMQLLASRAGGAIVPRPMDVLFGPGSRKNEGNVLMRNLALKVLAEYNDSTNRDKMQLTETIIDDITKKGGRFLKQNDDTKEWEEASHIEACRKIAHTFRNIRRPSRAKSKS